MNTQITEDYVSFETAKLLKEKGYKGSFNGYYNNAGCVVDKPNTILKEPKYQYYERVSLQMAMKWLREVHKKNINIIYDLQKFSKTDGTDGSVDDVEVYEVDIITKNGTFYIGNYNHYESACEAAIKYCLENLI